MNQEQAIEIARTTIEEAGWGWLEPIEVKKYRLLGIAGPVRWSVRTNVDKRGGNSVIIIDDKTGDIIRKGFLPR